MITGPGLRARNGAGPEPGGPGGAGPGPGVPGWLARQVQALFAEARRRRRRRRLTTAAAVLAVAVLAIGAVIGYRVTGQHGPGATRPGAVVSARAPRFTLPAAYVAWFDANGMLRIGNVATLAQRAVVQVAEPPGCTLVTAGQRIYWAGQSGRLDLVREYDLATGVARTVAPGWAVFASIGGRNIYIAQSSRRLLELPAGHCPRQRRAAPGDRCLAAAVRPGPGDRPWRRYDRLDVALGARQPDRVAAGGLPAPLPGRDHQPPRRPHGDCAQSAALWLPRPGR